MPEEYEEWLEDGRSDLDDAIYNLRDGRNQTAAFLLHQAAEKSLKAFQIYQTQDYSKKHNLVELAREEVPEKFLKTLADLNPVYTGVRYPETDEQIENLEELKEGVEELVEVAKITDFQHSQKIAEADFREDRETVESVKQEVLEVSSEEGIELEEFIVFGSRAREDYGEKSDVDILLVSGDFEQTPWNQRPRQFYLEWDYERLPTPEFICLTPEEFRQKKQKKPHIVRTAVEEGVELA